MILKSPVTASTAAIADFKTFLQSLGGFLPQLPPSLYRTFFSSAVKSVTMLRCPPADSSGARRRPPAIRAAGLSFKAPNHALQRTGTAGKPAVFRPLSLDSLGLTASEAQPKVEW